MKTLLAILFLACALYAQVPGPKVCAQPHDNVYRDGPCEMYRRCDWSGRKYRGVGYCYKVLITAPEKSIKDSFRKIVDICNDETRTPRTCQKEFDERTEDANIEDCWNRRLRMYHSAWFAAHCPQEGGMCNGNQDEDIKKMILMDRSQSAKECTPPEVHQ